MTRVRNYRREYDTYHATKKQKKNRAKRNAARSKLARAGRVSKGDGREVDHKRPLSRGGGNGRKNLRVTSRGANRRKGTGRR